MTLRQLREAKGLTQDAVASVTKLHQTAVSKLESGQVPSPQLNTIDALAAAYNEPRDVIVNALAESVAGAQSKVA